MMIFSSNRFTVSSRQLTAGSMKTELLCKAAFKNWILQTQYCKLNSALLSYKAVCMVFGMMPS